MLGRDSVKLEAVKQSLHPNNKHLSYAFDLLDENAVNEFLVDLKLHFQRIDGLVHCAGISSTIALRSLTSDKLEDQFNINVKAPFLLTKELVSKFKLLQEGSSVVFISSIMGMVGESGKTAYGITKGALLAGTKSLAIELAKKKIRVNTVSPGVVKTPLSSTSFYSQDEERYNKIAELHPLGVGETTDVAWACIYLLSDAAKWVTGSNLVIDGGYTAR